VEQSEQLDKLLSALAVYAKAPAMCKSDKQNNAFGRGASVYRYASLAALQRACLKKLAEQGLTITQLVTTSESGDAQVQTRLGHASGQFISATMRMAPDKQKGVHGYASAATYAQRMGLRAMVQIICVDELDPDEEADAIEDDGNAASGIETPDESTPARDIPSTLIDYQKRGLSEEAIKKFHEWLNENPTKSEADQVTALDRMFQRHEQAGKLTLKNGIRAPQATAGQGKVDNSGSILP
jgi:hypothetical protein